MCEMDHDFYDSGPLKAETRVETSTLLDKLRQEVSVSVWTWSFVALWQRRKGEPLKQRRIPSPRVCDVNWGVCQKVAACQKRPGGGPRGPFAGGWKTIHRTAWMEIIMLKQRPQCGSLLHTPPPVRQLQISNTAAIIIHHWYIVAVLL